MSEPDRVAAVGVSQLPDDTWTPAEYGAWLASQTPPLPDEAIDEAARIYAGWQVSEQHQQKKSA